MNNELDESFFTQANREKDIVRIIVRNTPKDDSSIFNERGIPEQHRLEDGERYWVLNVVYRVGFETSQFEAAFLDDGDKTEKDVIEFAEEMVRKEKNRDNRTFQDLCLTEKSDYFRHGPTYDFQYISKCKDILLLSGLTEYEGHLSKKVVEWHRENNEKWIEDTYHDKSQYVILMSYCHNFFPKSSLAYLASILMFNYYIRNDSMSVGYTYREIQLIESGAEELALEATRARTKAGEKGAKTSQIARDQRVKMFWEEIEKLAPHFPNFSISMIEAQAFHNAVARDTKLWSEGKGAMEKYLSDFIRSKEPYKSRYYEWFEKTA